MLYADDELRQQALSTVSVEPPRGWRIAKEKASKKIDAIVALSMACVAAIAHRGELSSRAARGFNRSLHVSQQKIVPEYGPIYVGQTFEMPATIIAQAQSGVVCVLAVFASEQMSLRRHLETIVKPWLIRHTPWAFRGRQIFGSYPGEGDQQQQWTSQQMLEEVLGGDWSPAQKPWESRKDSILDLLAKAVPGAFKPALQIDSTEARLLVDALSGRWSYEKNRRDT